MGLGKTIQIIATILCNPKQNTLIVVPRALLEQWETVIYRTTGHSALIFHGGERMEYSKEDLERRPVIITTYSLAAAGCSGKRKEKMIRVQKEGTRGTFFIKSLGIV